MQSNRLIELLNGTEAERNRAAAWLHENLLDPVRRYITLTGGRPEDGEDILQDGLEEILRKAGNGQLRVDQDNVTGLLVSICKNKWRSQIGRKVKGQEICEEKREEAMEEPGPELPVVVAPDEAHALLSHFLSTKGHVFLTEKYLAGKSEETIQEEYGSRSVEAVRVTLCKARKQVRDFLAANPSWAELINDLIYCFFNGSTEEAGRDD